MEVEEIMMAYNQVADLDVSEIKNVIIDSCLETHKKSEFNKRNCAYAERTASRHRSHPSILSYILDALGFKSRLEAEEAKKEQEMQEAKKEQDMVDAAVWMCKETIARPEISSSIKQIMQSNSGKINYSLEIVQLVAPAVAQIYGGVPALTIVGAIVLLCKQGIQNYITVQS